MHTSLLSQNAPFKSGVSYATCGCSDCIRRGKKIKQQEGQKKKHGHIRYLPSATLCVWLLGIRAFLSQKRVTVAPLNLRVL